MVCILLHIPYPPSSPTLALPPHTHISPKTSKSAAWAPSSSSEDLGNSASCRVFRPEPSPSDAVAYTTPKCNSQDITSTRWPSGVGDIALIPQTLLFLLFFQATRLRGCRLTLPFRS